MMNRRDFLATSFAASLAGLSVHEWLNMQPSQAQSADSFFRQYKTWTSDNLFLQGINAPVFHEIDLDRLEVTGRIPSDLEGVYLRNGPNPMFEPIAYQFPLDGDGMLHAVYFENSTARYRNRWIKTQGLIYEMAAGRALRELQFRNYANTSIVAHAGVLLALYETGLPYQVTDDLQTIGEWDFHGGIQNSMSAHPRHDPETGELHFHRYSLFTEPYLTYSVANAEGEIIHQLPVELPQPTLLHDMALTPNYAIIFDCPLVFDWQQAMQQGTPFVWQPNRPTRIGLLPRPGKAKQAHQPLWFETDSFWIWHFVNAYEMDQKLVIDCVAYPEMRLDYSVDSVLSSASHLHQVAIDLAAGTVTQRPLDDRIVEFPTVDAKRIGQPYQFTYTVHADLEFTLQKGMPNYFPALIQYDQINQRSTVHRFPPGCYAGEPLVVAKAGSTSERDCYVLTWVFNELRQASDLVILDADQFDGEPVAQIHLPVRVPFGAHGTWVPAGF